MSLDIQQWRKKPVVVSAVLLTEDNTVEVARWCDGTVRWRIKSSDGDEWQTVDIPTLEGTMTAVPGTYVVRGTRGEFYPVHHDPFHDTFEHLPPRSDHVV
jgi:hypothetical protein